MHRPSRFAPLPAMAALSVKTSDGFFPVVAFDYFVLCPIRPCPPLSPHVRQAGINLSFGPSALHGTCGTVRLRISEKPSVMCTDNTNPHPTSVTLHYTRFLPICKQFSENIYNFRSDVHSRLRRVPMARTLSSIILASFVRI